MPRGVVRRPFLRVGCLLTALVCSLPTGGPSLAETPEQAQPQTQARVRAEQSLARVRELQQQVGEATARYDAALSSVAEAVGVQILAEADLDGRRRAVADAGRLVDDRARALYMSGGPAVLYAELLTTGSPDLAVRSQMVSRVLATDRAAAETLTTTAASAQRQVSALTGAVRRHTGTERTVADAAARLTALLAEQQTLLNSARRQVRRLNGLAREQARLAQELAAERGAAAAVTRLRISRAQASGPPAVYRALYHAAASTCPGLSWSVLAAVGQVESGHGANTSTSAAGAMGPMQFLPATFAAYAVDGDSDGQLDISSPADAIFTAAHYLCANGAGAGHSGLARAIWHYNHAGWYVELVLRLAAQYV